MRRRALLWGLAALAGCSALPRDPDGTANQVRASRSIRLGVTPELRTSGDARALARRLERATGARVKPMEGGTEPLLAALERGELDLVIAWFDEKTPWATRVALVPPLARRSAGDRRLELRAAAKNGENRWVMLVETQSRAVAPELAQ